MTPSDKPNDPEPEPNDDAPSTPAPEQTVAHNPATEKPIDSNRDAARPPSDHPSALGTVAGTPADIARITENALTRATEGVPGYVLLGELGRGGMGVVYKARHAKLGHIVALKMLQGKARADRAEVTRFLAETQAVAVIRHENVVRVFDYGEADGHPFLALEYLPGGSLKDVWTKPQAAVPRAALSSSLGGSINDVLAKYRKAKRNESPPDNLAEFLSQVVTAKLLSQIARGVAAAHELGIVHRDLKPANVLFSEAGTPKVTDFGLAKHGAETWWLSALEVTQTGQGMGTPAYMAPEQARNAKFVGPQADVWALGVMLYEALAGERPFRGASTPDVLAKVLTANPPPLPPAVPAELGLMCRKCLAKNPADRYPTARELADDLDRFVRGEPISARPVDEPEEVSGDEVTDVPPAEERKGARNETTDSRPTGPAERTHRRVRRKHHTLWAEVVRDAPEQPDRQTKPRRQMWAEVVQHTSPKRSAGQKKSQRRVRGFGLAVFLALLCSGLVSAWSWDQLALRADQPSAERKPIAKRAEAPARQGERKEDMRPNAAADPKPERPPTSPNFIRARENATADLKRASNLREQGKFKEAENALDQAEGQAAFAAPELLAEIKRARRDLALVARFDDIRSRKWVWVGKPNGTGMFDTNGVAADYLEAFSDHPLIAKFDPVEVSRQVADSPIRTELVAALDDWALYEPDPALRDRLLEVARRVEPGRWTDRFRDPAVRADPTALAKLAADIDIGATAPPRLSVLAELMGGNGLDPSEFLAAAWKQYPRDFELAFAHGRWHTNRGDRDRAIEPLEAARVARPDDLPVLAALGALYLQQKKYPEAITRARAAIKVGPKCADAHATLGAALHRTGDVSGARAALTEAVRLDKRYAEALAKLPPSAPPPREVKPNVKEL